MKFTSAEAAYQYRKAAEYREWDVADKIVMSKKARDAKRLGDSVSTDQTWWDIREAVMLEVITAKSRQCPEFRNTLLASRGNALVEDTSHDFWARGRHGQGKNKLGHLLETLRDQLPAHENRKHTNIRSYEHDNPRYKGDPGCSFCGERGHSMETCGHGRPIRCRNCNGFRHKEKTCWYKSY